MGTIQHRAMIIIPNYENMVVVMYERAKELLGEKYVQHLSPIFPAVNGYDSFYIAPDGSKIGWEYSDEMQERRNQIKNEFMQNATVVEIAWGELGQFLTVNNRY